jgi:hypothetical protein
MAFDDRSFRSTSDAQADAMERHDNGDRLALAALRSALGVEPGCEPVDTEAVAKTGSDLLDIRAALVVAAGRFPLAGNEDIHGWFNALLNGVDALAAELAGRCDS